MASLAAVPLHPPRNPIIVVIGATGTGKSKLAVSLARRFNGEIINADAMQMYEGLPVITNKIPEDERQGVAHHMLDFIGLEEKPWTVRQFVDEAKAKIEEIRRRKKIPVVVGGTGYYVYGLLVKEGILRKREDIQEVAKFGILEGTSEEMHAKLMELDPAMAGRWHPKDGRRIRRTLELCLKTGRKASDIYMEQQIGRGEGDKMAEQGLHYDALLLWLEAEDSVLKARLNRRVDTMVADGLFYEALELSTFEQDLRRQGMVVDKTRGIWVSIGYKELQPWAEAEAAEAANATFIPRDSKLALQCIEAVKAGTRQYAKRQNRYVRIRLANALKEAGELDKLFLLDSTDLAEWHDSVEIPSQQLVSAFLEGHTLPRAETLSDLALDAFTLIDNHDAPSSSRVAHRCEICDKTLMSEKERQKHFASRTHKNTVQSQRRRALQVLPVPVEISG